MWVACANITCSTSAYWPIRSAGCVCNFITQLKLFNSSWKSLHLCTFFHHLSQPSHKSFRIMPIDELPNEIIVEIIKSVDSLKDLATICLCNKRFSSITLPILYSSPKLTSTISIQQFLITILDKPERACLVKSFDTRMKLLSIREETYMNDDSYCEMPAFYITTACRAKALIIAQEVFPSQSEATP